MRPISSSAGSTVYAVAMPQERTRAEPRNNHRARRRAASLFFLPATPAGPKRKILTAYDVDYVALNAAKRPRSAQALARLDELKPVLDEDGWTVYQVSAPYPLPSPT